MSLDALDMSGTIVSTAFKSKRIEAGTHSASLAVGNNNVVLVRLMVNGHITVKKSHYNNYVALQKSILLFLQGLLNQIQS